MATVYSKEKLTKMKLADLRSIAKGLGVNVAGLGAPDLVRVIVKKQNGAAGKGTAADPKAKGPRPLNAKQQEIAKKGAPPKVEKSVKAEKSSDSGSVTNQVLANIKELFALMVALAVAVGKTDILPQNLRPKKKGAKAPVVEEEDEEEEETEEEEDEDEEEEEEAPPKKAAKKSAKKAADEDEDEEEEEDDSGEEEEEDDEETVEVSPEDLAGMNLSQLKTLAENLNETDDGKEDPIDADESSPKKLRDAIRKWMEAHAEIDAEEEPKSKATKGAKGKKAAAEDEEEEEETDDEEEEETEEEDEEEESDEEEEEDEQPEFIRVGAKVECDLDYDGWVAGVIQKVNTKKKECTVTLDDESECVSPWESMRAAKVKAKARKAK